MPSFYFDNNDRGDENRAMSTSKQVDVSQIFAPDAQNIVSHTRKSKESTNFTIKDKIPFRWWYGKIVELSEEEKAAINRIRHQSRRQYQKPCSVCGEEGVLEYRKTSDGNSTLLCEPCCKSYIASAIKLQQKMEEKNEKSNNRSKG